MAGAAGSGAEYRQLLYLGSAGQPFRAGDFPNADWFAGGDGRGAVYPAGRHCGGPDHQVVRLAV
ncbi:hypothetical protein D3C78_1640700 [compost metagenome]